MCAITTYSGTGCFPFSVVKLAGDANYAGTDTDKYDEIWIAATGANRTYTFPDPANNTGRRQIVRNIGVGAYMVTVLPNGAEKIIVASGNEKWELTSFELLQASDWAEFESDGTNWIKINTPYWHKFNDPTTGWKASKVAWPLGADNFVDGLEVTFSGVPAGAKAIRVTIAQETTQGSIYYRKSGDTNISNTPHAASEVSYRLMDIEDDTIQVVIWLSSDYKAQFTVGNVLTDLYIAYPIEYLQ